MKKFLVIVAMAAVLTGCESPSMNKKVGLTDGAVSVAVAVALDEVKADKYEEAKAEVIQTCIELKEFLRTGSVADLPVDHVEDAMLKFLAAKGWGKYSSIVRSLFDYVESMSVDVDKLGPDNLFLLNLGLDEAIDAASRSRFDWRPVK